MLVYAKSAVLLLCTVWFCVNASPTSIDGSVSIDEQYPVKRYYIYSTRGVTFFEAWRLCQGIGLRLATITNKEDSRLMEKTIQASGYSKGIWWIGGTDHGSEGVFVWISTNQPVGYGTGYFDFAAGQPDNYRGNEHCLEVGRYGGAKWNDATCDLRQGYICENVL